MARVVFTSNLARHVAVPPTEASGHTVREVLDVVFAQHEVARGYVVDEQGALRTHMVIFVNGEPISDRAGLTDRVPEGAEIYVLQALSGG